MSDTQGSPTVQTLIAHAQTCQPCGERIAAAFAFARSHVLAPFPEAIGRE